MDELYVGVCLLDAPHALDRTFDYRLPSELIEGTQIGSFVTVPFGRSNKPKNGIVLELRDHTDAIRIKSVRAVAAPETCLSPEMLALCAYLKEQTLCTTGDAVRAMVPAGLTDAERPGQTKEARFTVPLFPKRSLKG